MILLILVGSKKSKISVLFSRIEDYGYDIETYNGIDELMERIEKSNPQLVIVDLLDKHSGGLNAITRTIDYQIPVLAIGEYWPKDVIEEAIHTGANNAITYQEAENHIVQSIIEIIGDPIF